jgi:hypothetical protein
MESFQQSVNYWPMIWHKAVAQAIEDILQTAGHPIKSFDLQRVAKYRFSFANRFEPKRVFCGQLFVPDFYWRNQGGRYDNCANNRDWLCASFADFQGRIICFWISTELGRMLFVFSCNRGFCSISAYQPVVDEAEKTQNTKYKSEETTCLVIE